MARYGNVLCRKGPGRKIFEWAEGDAVSLAQGAIDGAGSGRAHFGVVKDQGGNIPRMGVAVADEAPAPGGLVDRSFENPVVFVRTAQGKHWLGYNPLTAVFCGETE